jgi:galactokinase
MYNPAEVIQSFTASFNGGEPRIFFAPGKVNFLGEHLAAINEPVIEACIQNGIYIAIDKATGTTTHIINNDAFEQCFIENGIKHEPATEPWKQLLQTLFTYLQQHKFVVQPMHILFGGNLPNSNAYYYNAALLMGMLTAYNSIFNWQQTTVQLALIANKVANCNGSNQYAITDFITIAHGKKNCLVYYNTATETTEWLPIPDNSFELVITNTAYQNEQPTHIWNDRKEELTHALSFYKTINKRIDSFKQINSSVAEQFMYSMDDDVAKRSLYVAQEIERVQQGLAFAKENNWDAFAQLLFKSHKGLVDLFETSNSYLNFLVNESKLHSNCMGSKQLGKESYMLSMVKPFASHIITTNVLTSYKSVYQLQATAETIAIGDGIKEVHQ